MTTIVLELDDDDAAAIQGELAKHPNRDNLPDGDSNLPGAVLAEAVRSLEEYRDLWEAEHPRQTNDSQTP